MPKTRFSFRPEMHSHMMDSGIGKPQTGRGACSGPGNTTGVGPFHALQLSLSDYFDKCSSPAAVPQGAG